MTFTERKLRELRTWQTLSLFFAADLQNAARRMDDKKTRRIIRLIRNTARLELRRRRQFRVIRPRPPMRFLSGFEPATLAQLRARYDLWEPFRVLIEQASHSELAVFRMALPNRGLTDDELRAKYRGAVITGTRKRGMEGTGEEWLENVAVFDVVDEGAITPPAEALFPGVTFTKSMGNPNG